MSRRSAINKGRAYQKKICEIFKKAFNLTDEEIRTPYGSQPGPDLILSKSGQQKVGLTSELKNSKTIGILRAIEQVKANLYINTLPSVIFHKSEKGNKDQWITIPLEHYLELRIRDDKRKRDKARH